MSYPYNAEHADHLRHLEAEKERQRHEDRQWWLEQADRIHKRLTEHEEQSPRPNDTTPERSHS